MGRKRHTPEQIITALREAEVGLARGKSVKLISRELGITEQTYYRWRREALLVLFARFRGRFGERGPGGKTSRTKPPMPSRSRGWDPVRTPEYLAVSSARFEVHTVPRSISLPA